MLKGLYWALYVHIVIHMYVNNDCVTPSFDELSTTGLFLGPFFLLSPVITAEKDARWHTFETQNKNIGMSFLRKVVQNLNKKIFQRVDTN